MSPTVVVVGRAWAMQLCLFVWVLIVSGAAACADTSNLGTPAATGQTVVHMLDYVGVDYPGAVENGKIISADEFKEMTEFTIQIVEQLKTLPADPQKAQLVAAAEQLAKLVAGKASAQLIAEASSKLRWDVITAYKIAVVPRRPPDLEGAAALFTQNCAACHGAQGHGDGPAAKGLDPQPSDFHDAARMANRSVYGLYNTVTLGVNGTSMGAFTQLSDDERWALAFFVANLGVPATRRDQGKTLWQAGEARAAFPDVGNVATLSSNEIKARYGEKSVLVQDYLRANPAALAASKPAPIAYTRDKLTQAMESYRQGQQTVAQQLAVSAYLEGFELIEASLDTVDAKLRLEIETRMIALRSAMRGGAPTAEVEAQFNTVLALLERADEKLKGTEMSLTATAISAFVILLREGLEALLVVATIIAFLAKAGRRDAVRYIHFGWISALVLGIATWFVASYLIEISGASREVTEGIAALFSAVILIYVGFWLHSKAYAHRWRHFIETHLKGALTKGTLWALASVSFIAVYREMFETVLFYEALWTQAGAAGGPAMIGGLTAAAVILGVVGWLIFRYGMRLPIGPFFAISSILLAVLAVVFVGQGIAALQEAGKIDVDALNFTAIPLLGVYPTMQSVLSQLLALAVVAIGFTYSFVASHGKREV